MQNKTHWSIDLETLSTKANAHILAIGLCGFNMEDDTMSHHEIILNSNKQLNSDIDVDTILWWLKQSDDARSRFTDFAVDKISLPFALQKLQSLISGCDTVWGNGATFDISILEHAYFSYCVKIPWKFYNIMDMRTIVAIAKSTGFNPKDIIREGVAHSAVDDAVHQAKVIKAAYDYITDA